MKDILILIPEITLTLTMLIVFVLGLFIRTRALFTIIGIAGAALSFYLMQNLSGSAFGDMVRVDALSFSFKTVCLIAMSFALLMSYDYKRINDHYYSEYTALIMLSTVGMLLMASASDLLIVYLSLELMSLSIYVLTGFARSDIRSNEAALKYFLLGTLGAIVFLFSIALVYGSTGTTNLYKIAEYMKVNSLVSNPVLLLSVCLASAAFAFKIAAVPFHQWSPDVYEGAPTTITAFMSVGPKAAAFAAFGRIFYDAFLPMHIDWSGVLIIISVLSMALGNILAMSQGNMKRMLAYSSIAHAGYMLLGIASGNYSGLQAVSFYMLIYAFMNMGAFTIVVSVDRGEEIETYKGLFKREPLKAFSMLIFMAALAGIPPTAGFVGKLNLFMAAINAGYVVPVVFAVLFSILSAFYYLRIVAYMFFSEYKESEHYYMDSPALTIATILTVFFVCLIGVLPSVIV